MNNCLYVFRVWGGEGDRSPTPKASAFDKGNLAAHWRSHRFVYVTILCFLQSQCSLDHVTYNAENFSLFVASTSRCQRRAACVHRLPVHVGTSQLAGTGNSFLRLFRSNGGVVEHGGVGDQRRWGDGVLYQR